MAVPGRRAQDARLVQARVWAAEARGRRQAECWGERASTEANPHDGVLAQQAVCFLARFPKSIKSVLRNHKIDVKTAKRNTGKRRETVPRFSIKQGSLPHSSFLRLSACLL